MARRCILCMLFVKLLPEKFITDFRWWHAHHRLDHTSQDKWDLSHDRANICTLQALHITYHQNVTCSIPLIQWTHIRCTLTLPHTSDPKKDQEANRLENEPSYPDMLLCFIFHQKKRHTHSQTRKKVMFSISASSNLLTYLMFTWQHTVY